MDSFFNFDILMYKLIISSHIYPVGLRMWFYYYKDLFNKNYGLSFGYCWAGLIKQVKIDSV